MRRAGDVRAWAGGALGAALVALVPGAVGTQQPPNRAQATAAVAEFKRVHAECGATPACEAAARRRFVEVMSCVVHGRPAVNPATLDQDFTGYVDLVSAVLETPPAGAAGAPGPCFAAAGAPAPTSARPAPPAPPASEGPTAETLRRFRQQIEEQSQPVSPTTVGEGAAEQDKLKADVDAMRQRLRSGAAPGATGAASAPVPLAAPAPVPVAPAPLAAPAPAPAGTTTIQGGPTPPGTVNIQGSPTSPTPGIIPYPRGAQPPARPVFPAAPQGSGNP